MTPWDEPIAPEDEPEVMDEPSPYRPDPDPVTRGLGAEWYAIRYTVDECRAVYEGSAILAPSERFDRFYPHSTVGPVLVDILVGDRDAQGAQAVKKHVEFKRDWCEKHDRRYLVLSEEQADDPMQVRALLEDAEPAATAAEPAASRRAQRRGQVQRPKAGV